MQFWLIFFLTGDENDDYDNDCFHECFIAAPEITESRTGVEHSDKPPVDKVPLKSFKDVEIKM